MPNLDFWPLPGHIPLHILHTCTNIYYTHVHKNKSKFGAGRIMVVVSMSMAPVSSYVNAWSVVGGMFWEGVGDVALLEEGYHWGWVSKSQHHSHVISLPLSSSNFWIRYKLSATSPAPSLPAAWFTARMIIDETLETTIKLPIKCSLS